MWQGQGEGKNEIPAGTERKRNQGRNPARKAHSRPFFPQRCNHSIGDSSEELAPHGSSSALAQTGHQLQRHSSWIRDRGTSRRLKLSSGNQTWPSPNRGRDTNPALPCSSSAPAFRDPNSVYLWLPVQPGRRASCCLSPQAPRSSERARVCNRQQAAQK